MRASGAGGREFLVVSVLVLTALMLVGGNNERSLSRAKGAVRRQDCRLIRAALERYVEEQRRGPESLGDVVSAGYLPAPPRNRATGRKMTLGDVEQCQ